MNIWLDATLLSQCLTSEYSESCDPDEGGGEGEGEREAPISIPSMLAEENERHFVYAYLRLLQDVTHTKVSRLALARLEFLQGREGLLC